MVTKSRVCQVTEADVEATLSVYNESYNTEEAVKGYLEEHPTVGG